MCNKDGLLTNTTNLTHHKLNHHKPQHQTTYYKIVSNLNLIMLLFIQSMCIVDMSID